LQRFDQEFHRRQRCAEFVRDVGDQIAPRAFQQAQLRHIAHQQQRAAFAMVKRNCAQAQRSLAPKRLKDTFAGFGGRNRLFDHSIDLVITRKRDQSLPDADGMTEVQQFFGLPVNVANATIRIDQHNSIIERMGGGVKKRRK
jgi:hypothetical protein